MLKLPANTQVHHWSTSIVWFDDDGILYSIPKKDAPHPETKEEALIEIEKFKKFLNYKKTCIITLNNSTSPPPKKEDRDWIAAELNSIVKAMAILSTSPLSKMAADLFFSLKPPAYPIKSFTNSKDAKEWIKQYL